MSILAIDTASAEFALAIDEDGAVRTWAGDAAQDHSKLILPAIDAFLGGTKHTLEAVVVVRGPGAYAGIRVGIATAQGLAIAVGVPLWGVGTLEAVAAAAGGDCTAIHPAGRNEFAVQQFAGGVAAGPMRAVAADGLHQFEQLAGEGAGALGGREVTARERCAAALALVAAKARAGVPAGEVEAEYLREPNITVPRRAQERRAG